MLFLHHGEADHRLWDEQVEHFRARYDVIVPDLPGFGRSDKPNLAYTRDLYVRFLEVFSDALQLSPMMLVGACLGSAMSLAYTAVHPQRVRALVLINTLTTETLAAGVLGRATHLLQRCLARAALRFVVKRGLLPRRLRERPTRLAFGDSVIESWAAYFNEERWRDRRSILTWISMGEHIATYTAPHSALPPGFPPVCSIWGRANHILPAVAGRAFCEMLCPEEEHMIEGAGHMAPLERPAEVNAIIESFLQRCAPVVSSSAVVVRYAWGTCSRHAVLHRRDVRIVL
jgi:pimeloyl-ACP methyl ester carboxylesterase